MKTTHKIHISELKPGMLITGTDDNSLTFPFFNHKLENLDPVDILKEKGISYVYVADESDNVPEKDCAQSDAQYDDSFFFQKSCEVADFAEVRTIFESLREKSKDLLSNIKKTGTIDEILANEIANKLVEMSNYKPTIFPAMTYLDNFADYSVSHSLNVAVISIALGKRLGRMHDELKIIGLCGLLHDVGMTRISDEIINKPERLTEEEYNEIKKHPEFGYQIITANGNLPLQTAEVALQHHEKPDGSGYPHGLKERRISYFAKIISIADVYDAITSKKPYIHERTPSEALKILFSWSGSHFNSTLVKFFINTMGIYPIGTLVLLDSGELGIIVDMNKKDLTRPKILLITDANKKKIEDTHICDLSNYELMTMKPLKTIISSQNPKKYGINTEEEIDKFVNRFKKEENTES